MLQFIIGIVLVLGFAGGLEDPSNSIWISILGAFIGLAIMFWGVLSLSNKFEEIR